MARVLVVEDEPEVRRLVRTVLETRAHVVIEAANVGEAEKRLDDLPDLALVDLDMPGENGVLFLLRLRQHPKLADMPAAFMTAHPADVTRFLPTGLAAGILEKPFRTHELLEMVERLMVEPSGKSSASA